MGTTMSLNEVTHELVTAAQSGESAAREALIESCRDELDRHLRLRIGAHLRGTLEVEDVFQETVTAALESLTAFRWNGEGSFLRWLKAVAENRILTLARKKRRTQILFVEWQEPLAGDPSPSNALRRGERFDRLQAALDCLEPDYREVIVLARLKGLRLKDVATRIGRSPNAVAHLLSRALTRLKEVFGDTGSLSLPPQRLHECDPRKDTPHDP